MSNRTLIELNHDYCPKEDELLQWAKDMVLYMRSRDRSFLPFGVTFKNIRHHSEACPLEQSGRPTLKELQTKGTRNNFS